MNNSKYILTIWKTNKTTMDIAAGLVDVSVEYLEHPDNDFYTVYVPVDTPDERVCILHTTYTNMKPPRKKA